MTRLPTHILPEYLRTRREALRRQWVTQAIGLVTALVTFLGAGIFLIPPINQIRKDRQLVIDPRTVAGLPPGLSLLGKLGTFRALAIDWAYIRADRLKDQGKTYEADKLYDIICKLAPRFPQVWVNAAWNMAYNISVMKYSPQERWHWVKNGIEILRDKGIQYNPLSVGLYKELSWIYWHKIGDFLDDEHLNYKRALAVEMEKVLGPPPLALTDREYFDWFRKIVDAPRDLKKVIETDPEVAALAFKLRGAELLPNITLLEWVARHLRPELRPEELRKAPGEEDSLLSRQRGIVTDPKHGETLDRLLAAVRSDVLREKYKLDPDYMLELMVNQYGPLDWRCAAAHSLYWSSYGDKITRGREGATRGDVVNTARFVFFSLQSLIMRGKVILWPNFDDPFASYIQLAPDIRFIPYLYDTYMRIGKEQFGNDPRFKEGTPGPNYMNGFVSSMQNWVQLLFLHGGKENIERAEAYYVWLRENNPHPDGSVQEAYSKTVEEFVMGDILEQLQTYKAAESIIQQFVQRALMDLVGGEKQSSLQNFKRARLCYDFWMTDTTKDYNERRKLQPIRVIVRDVIESFFTQMDIAPLIKARLWKELPLEQRQMVYDRLRPYFEMLCDRMTPAWDVTKAFPEPAAMEEFRKKEIETRGSQQEGLEGAELPK